MKRDGFSLMELLIIIALVAILLVGSGANWIMQIKKGRDSKRKADLKKIQMAFEEYYNDRDRYPDNNILENCGSEALKSWGLPNIPCDDQGPYIYIPGPMAQSYAVYTILRNSNDPDIERIGCGGANGCNVISCPDCNYGVSNTGIVSSP